MINFASLLNNFAFVAQGNAQSANNVNVIGALVAQGNLQAAANVAPIVQYNG